MTRRPAVNILHVHTGSLFAPHFDATRDGFEVAENGGTGFEWDLLIVFEALAEPATYMVRKGGAVFVSGEPPEISRHSRAFLSQFDAIYCAGAPIDSATHVSHEQHFNNWHYGLSARSGYRVDHRELVNLPLPQKEFALSTVTSNLNYLPMHIKRRSLIERLSRDYADQIDFFGRPHRFVEYKEDAILPYRFHLCVENCAVPDLWTEKVADALLGYSVPVYAGCSNIDAYFPGATIAIDLDDYARTRNTIDHILNDGVSLYRHHLDALVLARQRLIDDFDISTLVGTQLRRIGQNVGAEVTLMPEADLPLARVRDLAARVRRKAVTMAWRGLGRRL